MERNVMRGIRMRNEGECRSKFFGFVLCLFQRSSKLHPSRITGYANRLFDQVALSRGLRRV